MARVAAPCIAFLAACACSPSPLIEARREIERCIPTDSGDQADASLRITAEAIVLIPPSPSERGTYARSASCPDVRLRLGQTSPDISRRFEGIAAGGMLGEVSAVVRLVAWIWPVAYRDDGLIAIRIDRLEKLERLGLGPAAEFRRRFNLR